MNLVPINPYHIIEFLKAENEALTIENEVLRAEVARYVTVDESDNKQDEE